MKPFSRSAILVLLSFLTLSGCELYSHLEDNRVVEGVSFAELFREPSTDEIGEIELAWSVRNTQAVDVVTEAQHQIGSSTLKIVSHRVGSSRHYGAVLAPDLQEIAALPILVYSHGGDSGVSIDEEVLLVLSFLDGLQDEIVVVVPSFRSEPLRYEDNLWLSEGPPSPWDYDVDDALALLSATPLVAPVADMSRVAVVGFSRGAGVGLLMGIRDPRIDAVVEYFGPTDFFGPFVQDVVEEALLGSLRNLPGLDFLNQEYIQPVKRGEIDIEDARPELIRRSPVLFVDQIPDLQIHHGASDSIVPVSQGESLIAAMQLAGRGNDDFEYYIYPGGEHNPLTLEGSLERSISFLTDVLGID